MPRKIQELNPRWIGEALAAYAQRSGIDLDLSTFDVEPRDEPGKFKLKFIAAWGKRRKVVTTSVDGKRTVIGWGDTEEEAWKMAREHPRWGGHPYTWTVGEDAFDKIAAGDFDASSWGTK